MITKLFLGIVGVVFLGYGAACFLDPGLLSTDAGLTYRNATGSAEIRAMYGGLQGAIGVLALLAVLMQSLVRPALVTLSFLIVGLFLTRLVAAFMDGAFSFYTLMALGMEVVIASVAIVLLVQLGRAERG
jgi:hypothetical protein